MSECPKCGGTDFWQPLPPPSWKICNSCSYEVPYYVEFFEIAAEMMAEADGG